MDVDRAMASGDAEEATRCELKATAASFLMGCFQPTSKFARVWSLPSLSALTPHFSPRCTASFKLDRGLIFKAAAFD
jgi:hypothetical protein